MTLDEVTAELAQVANELGTLIETAIGLIGAVPAVDTTQLEAVSAQLKAQRDALAQAVDPTLPPVTP